MPLELNISPLIWQTYINTIFDCLESRKYFEAIIDNLLLFTSTKIIHNKIRQFLKVLLKNRLKISPKKCQLFRKEFQHMGSTIFTEDRRVCIKPLRSRLEAIQNLKPPTSQGL